MSRIPHVTTEGARQRHGPVGLNLTEVRFGAGERYGGVVMGSGPAVFLVHGWGGGVEQWLGAAELLAKHGYQAVVLDLKLPESSTMPAGRSVALEAAVTVRAAAEKWGQPAGVIAHSFGALATCLSMELGLKPGRLAFVAPVRSADLDAREARRSEPSCEPPSQRGGSSASDCERPPPSSRAPRPSVRLRPLLIVHDRTDRTTPYEEAEALAQTWPGCILESTEGLGHTRILAEPAIQKRLVGFIADH